MTHLTDEQHAAQMADMKAFDEQMPCIGIFWYSPEEHNFFGVHKKEITPKMVEEAACDDFLCYEYIESIWNDGWRYGGLYDADIPKSLPKEYRQQYSILLDYYTKQELENYRRIYGDGVLQTLYEDIYGYYLEE